MKTPRVPDRITSPIRRLCNRIAPGETPVYVKVIVESGTDVNDCFINVENKIKRDGGKVQYGWVIWYLPGILMEAEFHAIWISPKGESIDISPHPISLRVQTISEQPPNPPPSEQPLGRRRSQRCPGTRLKKVPVPANPNQWQPSWH